MVGSANLTAGGLYTNAELSLRVEGDENDLPLLRCLRNTLDTFQQAAARDNEPNRIAEASCRGTIGKRDNDPRSQYRRSKTGSDADTGLRATNSSSSSSAHTWTCNTTDSASWL